MITTALQGESDELEQERARITPMIMRLFDHWKLTTQEQLTLLGFSKAARATLGHYRTGKRVLANDRDKLERAAVLLSIHKNLRLLFPHDRDVAYAWMKLPNRAFGGLTPTEMIDRHGMVGLLAVRGYLDKQRGH